MPLFGQSTFRIMDTSECYIRFMRMLFVLNGKKKIPSSLEKVFDKLKKRGCNIQCEYTQCIGDGIRIATQNAHQFDIIIAVGGDGTLHECANGLMKWKSERPKETCASLGLYPLGTGNDFARAVGKSELRKLFTNLLDSPLNFQPIDLGCVSYEGELPTYFINVADIGFGSEVVERLEKYPSLFGGAIKFGLAIIRTFLTYKKKEYQFETPHYSFKGKALMILFSNGGYLGGGVHIASNAQLNDGQLQIVVMGNFSLFDYFKYLPKLRKGLRIDHPEITYLETSSASLHGPGKMELDGEIGPLLPTKIEVAKGAIQFLFPN